MRRLLLALALIAQVDVEPFTGLWTAEVAGTTFVRLELVQRNGQLAGTLGLGNFRQDETGVVSAADPIRKELAIANPVVRGSLLSFTRIDGGDPEPFELQLGDGGAFLIVVVTPDLAVELKEEGIPAPKPIALKKSAR